MQRTDKFLVGIVAGILVLVGAGLAVMLLRPEPSYRPDDSPADSAHNYLLAVQRADFQRAYGYLSPELPGYPTDAASFDRAISRYLRAGRTASFEVIETRETGDLATVTIEQTTFQPNGLFGSSTFRSTHQMRLVRAGGEWRIEHSEVFWAGCLEAAEGCE